MSVNKLHKLILVVVVFIIGFGIMGCESRKHKPKPVAPTNEAAKSNVPAASSEEDDSKRDGEVGSAQKNPVSDASALDIDKGDIVTSTNATSSNQQSLIQDSNNVRVHSGNDGLSTVNVNGKTYQCHGSIAINNGEAFCNGEPFGSEFKKEPCYSEKVTLCGHQKIMIHDNGGGTVSLCTKKSVSEESFIDRTSIVCGKATIGDKVRIINSSKVLGHVTVLGVSIIDKSIVSGSAGIYNSKITNESEITDSSEVRDSELDDTIVSGSANILDRSILKDSIIGGSADITKSNLTDVVILGSAEVINSNLSDENILGSRRIVDQK